MAKLNSLKLGIFVTIVFVLFVYALFRISDGVDLFGRSVPVYVDFKDVKGLQVGNNVRFAGITIGEVKSIAIKNDTTLRVKMDLDANVGEFLRENVSVDIATDGLVGNMIITMLPGKGEAGLVTSGTVLKSQPKVALSSMLSELSTTNEKIAAITSNLLEITEKLNHGSGGLALLLNDQALAENLLRSSQQLQLSTENFNRSTQQFNQILAGVNAGEGNLGYLLKSNAMEEEVKRLGENLDTLLRVRTEPIFKELEITSAALLSSGNKVKALMTRLEEEDGIVNTLISDTVSARHLRATLTNLDAGSEKLVENMEALKHNWFFRGYFKKQAKNASKTGEKENE
jgi:phospholipid/cholesterol/gamma-HCH transport system substrate-binding protein